MALYVTRCRTDREPAPAAEAEAAGWDMSLEPVAPRRVRCRKVRAWGLGFRV